jgi:hypothetical protein
MLTNGVDRCHADDFRQGLSIAELKRKFMGMFSDEIPRLQRVVCLHLVVREKQVADSDRPVFQGNRHELLIFGLPAWTQWRKKSARYPWNEKAGIQFLDHVQEFIF